MPEIKVKHVVSFSSEDKVFKAENLLKPETYRKWKCATQGEKKVSAILQFEKASQIHSIDIGNEHAAFVEVLVSRSSDTSEDFKVLLVASSFMSPLESRNGTNVNRVRMFGPDKLAQNLKNEKWDTIQIVCTQPFNKNVQYGLTFVKFHSPPEAADENNQLKIGGFKLKPEEDDDKPAQVGSWFLQRKEKVNTLSSTSPSAIRQASSFAAATLASGESLLKSSPGSSPSLKRKHDVDQSTELSAKKQEISNRVKNSVYDFPSSSQESKSPRMDPTPPRPKTSVMKKEAEKKVKEPVPFHKLMKKVVFTISGFQNPLRSDIREFALEMGAFYKPDWNSACTHLVCAFVNTPKYAQVQKAGGRIVTKDWIIECYKKRKLLPWRNYMLGKYKANTSSDEEVSESDEETRPKLQANTKTDPVKPMKEVNGIETKTPPATKDVSLPSTSKEKSPARNPSDSSSAESDYGAKTDVDENSDQDTEDDVQRVENSSNKTTDEETKPPAAKPDTASLELPHLPDFWKNKRFFFYGRFSEKQGHELKRYITAYNGIIENFMSESIKYVVTLSKWNKDFDEALCENDNLIFVNPKWIHICHQRGKMVPYQPYIIVPEEED